MNKEKFNQARSNFKRYLDDGLIKKTTFNKIVFDTFMKNHNESLSTSKFLFENNKSNLW